MRLYTQLLHFLTGWAVNAVVIPEITLKELEVCLKHGNFPLSSFVPRNPPSRIYVEVNYQWNTFNYIEPLAYILPETTAQVQTTVKCTRLLKISISIKSGGHSYPKYSFGDNSSVVIDLQKIDYMKVNPNSSTALIGPGILMAQLNYYARKQGNFVTPGGHCVSVGYGGAAQGGGYGYLSKRFGLLADNVLAFEMVTADGNVLTIDGHHHEDLFWALRGGGGGNFGIVTQFKIRVHDATNLRYNFITLKYSLSQFVEAFDAFQKFCSNNVKKTVYSYILITSDGIMIVIFDINSTKPIIESIIQEFPKSSHASIKNFSNFLDVVLAVPLSANITKTSQLKNYTRHVTPRSSVRTKSYFTTTVVSKAKVKKLGQVFMRIPYNNLMGFIAFGGAINSIPEDATAFVHRSAIHTSELKIGSNDADTLTWLEDFDEAMLLLDDGESYQNIMDDTLPDYLQRYYGPNLVRLRQIKTKYDPTNYFKFPQSIPLL